MKVSKYCYELLLRTATYVDNPDNMLGRATGKSTAHYLDLISRAMRTPETSVKIYSDHDPMSQVQNDMAFKEVVALIHTLGLDWFECRRMDRTITYKPYVYVQQKVVWEIVS